jgi:hypothetical protein
MQTKKDNSEQTRSPERSSPAAIRFSDGDGKVLSWTGSNGRAEAETQIPKTPQPDRAWAVYLTISLVLAAFVAICWVTGVI